MFGETTILYVMIWNHPMEATIKNWLFGVLPLPHLPTTSANFAHFFRSFSTSPRCLACPAQRCLGELGESEWNHHRTLENLRNGYRNDTKNMHKNCIKFQVGRSFSPIIFAYCLCRLVVSLGAMDEQNIWLNPLKIQKKKHQTGMNFWKRHKTPSPAAPS